MGPDTDTLMADIEKLIASESELHARLEVLTLCRELKRPCSDLEYNTRGIMNIVINQRGLLTEWAKGLGLLAAA